MADLPVTFWRPAPHRRTKTSQKQKHRPKQRLSTHPNDPGTGQLSGNFGAKTVQAAVGTKIAVPYGYSKTPTGLTPS